VIEVTLLRPDDVDVLVGRVDHHGLERAEPDDVPLELVAQPVVAILAHPDLPAAQRPEPADRLAGDPRGHLDDLL